VRERFKGGKANLGRRVKVEEEKGGRRIRERLSFLVASLHFTHTHTTHTHTHTHTHAHTQQMHIHTRTSIL